MLSHPQRERVARELHARPFITLRAPVELLHLALLHDADAPHADREHLQALCARHGVAPPPDTANQMTTPAGEAHVKWERHTEFTTWTVWWAAGSAPFQGPAAGAVLEDWLASLPGLLLVAVRVCLVGRESEPPSRELLDRCFDPLGVCGSALGDGTTHVWTDFHPDADGNVRMLLHDRGADDFQLGRRVQRLLEIETYRSMALLGLPVAQSAAPRIVELERRLATVTGRLDILANLEAEQSHLAELMKLSAESEELEASTAYRFSASRAYFDIVNDRLRRITEEPLGTLPTIGSFMNRRLSPAMRTCESTVRRQGALAARILRAANLLRTRVELAIQAQNRDLLRSMERRARLQLRLQQTVEGLSVAAITYYGVGLVGYLAKGADAAGMELNADLLTGIAVPAIAASTWYGLQRFRRRIEHAEGSDA